MKKTAFIYDKWASSFGGGEVVTAYTIQALIEAGYHTTLISGTKINFDDFINKFDIDISKANQIQIFNDPTKIKEITKNADLYINLSFWDYSIGLAKKNIYYTFFPTELKNNLIKNILYKLLKPVEIIDNQYIFYSLKPNTNYQLSFSVVLNEFSKSNLENFKWNIENCKVTNQNAVVNHVKNKIDFTVNYVANSETIYLHTNRLINLHHYLLPNKLNSILRSGSFPNIKSNLIKYDTIISQSEFVSNWIEKYWHHKTKIIFPPVKLVPKNSINKKNQICSVGRFFVAGHNKKQEIMIQAFKQLYDLGLRDWSLHLAGGLGNEPESQLYVKRLQDQSKNYPIFFHFNQSKSFIDNLYSQSKIYWHAAGFGIDKNKEPVKFEHFGITPIEAMSGGCIPVLFNGGGLSEVISILKLDKSTHLFNSIDGLVKNTNTIIRQNIILPKNFYQMLLDIFGFERFKKQIISLVN